MNQLDNPEKINPFTLKQIQEALDTIRHLGLISLSDWMVEGQHSKNRMPKI